MIGIDASDIRRTLDRVCKAAAMGVELVDLTEAELAARLPAMASGFAASVTENFGVPRDRAEQEAERDLRATLPDGVGTEGQLLRRAVVDGADVGFLWLSLPGTTHPAMAWLSEIEVTAGERGRGYGTQIIAAGEEELRRRGIARLGLHVFGSNTGARRLYERLGYRVLTQVRARPLEPAPDDGTVTLAATYERGVAPEGTLAYTVLADGAEVGSIRFGLPTPERPTTGLVVHLEIAPEQRRRGYGRRALAAAELEMSRHGVPRIGLRLPGEPAALAFGAALGLPLVSQQMVKDL